MTRAVLDVSAGPPVSPLSGRRWWGGCLLVLAIALAATVPCAGDLGLTWDEPEYRHSEQLSAQWWQRLAAARSWQDVSELIEPNTLLYYWSYGRNYAYNVHPPLAGQLCSLTHLIFGRWMKDIPSRRLASIFEYSLTVTLAFGFLARRYGAWVSGVAAGSLLLMPRVFGDGLIAATDTPGLFFWAATALAFWNALHAQTPRARARWRVLVGVLLGLSFLTKMVALAVVLPMAVWLLVGYLPRAFKFRDAWAVWIDGLVTTAAVLAPLYVALLEMDRLARLLPPPGQTDLFLHHPRPRWSGLILALPLFAWGCRRLLAKIRRGSRVWGVERPALEVWAAGLAIAPVVVWLGNPGWWRETLTRLAHFIVLQLSRREDYGIQIFYLGQTYAYSLPWHNAWVLMAVTVPVGIFGASIVGLVYAIRVARKDRLPLYFVVHMLTLPVLRMTDTPAHDGVRLFLPTFFFLAGLAGWGTIWLADALARLTGRRGLWVGLILGSGFWSLVTIHPYELSYYNSLIGEPKGARRAGFELTYWYDAFNGPTLAEINRRLPPNAAVEFLSPLAFTSTFSELQALGELRGDLRLEQPDQAAFPYAWLLMADSKATAFHRLLFAMKPFYESRPRQLGGLRIVTVADPVAVSRAWALQLLVDAPSGGPPEPNSTPGWVKTYAPRLGRFWGEGVTKYPRLNVNEEPLAWAVQDPDGLRAAARAVAEGDPARTADARRLFRIFTRHDPLDLPGQLASRRLLRARPKALVEAVEILIARHETLRTLVSSYRYIDPETIGGYLDQALE
jgi:4-amino-4-deoxy-L-arabinose transferase-like glycosyltransferase